jgi:hypothetical protein
MNEKISSLFNVCGFPNDEIMEICLDANKSLYIQRFAELIINECIKAIDDGDGSMSSMAEHSMRSVCQSDIRSHFGIKKPFTVTVPQVCEHQIDGVCQLHNLFCGYPKCVR